MRVSINQELEWSAQDASILCGSRPDNWRFYEAGGGSKADFELGWSAVQRWMTAVKEGIESGDYHAACGFVMYLVAGRSHANHSSADK